MQTEKSRNISPWYDVYENNIVFDKIMFFYIAINFDCQ